jgi:hypothetical protein
MTKYPIVFITGPRSLFFYEKLGGVLQDYVEAHGYVVLNPALPFRGKIRSKVLSHWLEWQRVKVFHFILSRNSQLEFADILKAYPKSTVTYIEDFKNDFCSTNPPIPLKYKFHEWFCRLQGTQPDDFLATFPVKNVVLCERFLDRCIELAENEET